MSDANLRTAAAARILGVSPNTLRSWTRRFGFPSTKRTAGNHRCFDPIEIGQLKWALDTTGQISGAIALVKKQQSKALSADALAKAKWRVGKESPRSIFAQTGSKPSSSDCLIGVMDTADLATTVVATHNDLVAW